MNANVYFAGAGGSSLGLERAGYTVVGYEYWQPAIDTHRANGMTCVEADLSDPAIDATLPACDLAWFSPPCQPFSAAGDRQGEFDDRDGFPWTLRIIAATLPAVVIIENVKGLTFTTHADYFTGVLTSIRRLGYHVEWKVLNCADYGVPQTRERTIIVARRDGGPITWPAPTHTEHPGLFTKPWVTMADALPNLPADLVARHQRGAGMVERHGERPDRPLTMPAMTVRQGGGGDPGGFVLCSPSPVVRVNNVTSTTGDYYRRTIEAPCPTIGQAAGVNWWVEGPENAIRLTIDELATLQGFPPGYVFTGTKTAQAKQLGNAVPPRLAEVLAAANRPALIPQ